MLSSKNLKLLLISIVTIFLLVHFVAYKVFSCTIILEIEGENREKEICLHSDDINKIGINERLGGTRVEISIAPKFVPILSKFTEQNVGKKLAIRTQTEIIFSGTIVEPIIDGIIVFPRSSEEHAKATIKKIGRKADYHLKLSPEETENAKVYTEAAKNPYSQKAIDAHISGDYKKAVQYAKKAIEINPKEPTNYMLLSMIHYSHGDKRFALDQAVKAEELIEAENITKYPGIYISLGQLYGELGKNDMAVKSYQKFLSTGENNLKVRLGLAKTYEKMGHKELAIQEYIFLSKSVDEYFRQKGLEGVNRLKN